MTSRFASGKHAIALCDVCGFKVPYKDLKPNIVRGRITGVLTCPDCNDPDHPQNYTGTIKAVDGVALRNPRPDNQREASRALYVPIRVGAGAFCYTGRVTAVTS